MIGKQRGIPDDTDPVSMEPDDDRCTDMSHGDRVAVAEGSNRRIGGNLTWNQEPVISCGGGQNTARAHFLTHAIKWGDAGGG